MNSPVPPPEPSFDAADSADDPQLRACVARHASARSGFADLAAALAVGGPPADLEARLARQDACIALLEQALWSGAGDFAALLADYQALFREQEALIAQHGNDARHDFIIAIPVADRPAHLRACLESLLQLCLLYDYGGHASGTWDKLRIVVSEDSRDAAHILHHLDLVAEYRAKGLDVIHYGLDEQYERLHALPSRIREKLGRLLTTQPRDRFYLKGQAANRNLACLKLADLTRDKSRTLYYFVDSDQSFCVNRPTDSGDEAVAALNYFATIDRIFRTTDTELLTGKMVGDPPVSPSVMAANFLDDVDAFFAELAERPRATACRFHGRAAAAGDAAYHDMAGLFGFEAGAAPHPYPCRLGGEHDHGACLDDFSTRLNAFFFGEHLTRKTMFRYGQGFRALCPARTLYPGNYIARHSGLRYVIPFGHLRLRMSGPTAGRLIAAEIGSRFASFNMPNLHRRTTAAGPDDDFRPGVEQKQAAVDLSNEFERQFFGDLMLFTTEALVQQTDVAAPFERALIEPILDVREAELLGLYRQKHEAVRARCRRLAGRVFAAGHWWLDAPAHEAALGRVRAFIDNIERNFGADSPGWRLIESAGHRAARKRQIVDALANYRAERNAWDTLLQADS